MPVKGIPYWDRTTERFLDLAFCNFSLFFIFELSAGISGLGGYATEPYGSSSYDFWVLSVFASVFGLLELPVRGSMTICEHPKSAWNGSRNPAIQEV